MRNLNKTGLLIILCALFILVCYPVTAVEGCLAQKPNYMDDKGVIKFNQCYGKDRIVGTNDDCGCPSGSICQSSGRCQISCTDGTLQNQCSSEKPLYCNNRGVLVVDSLKCGCSEKNPINLTDGRCGSELNFTASSLIHFENGMQNGIRMSQTSFSNLASDKIATVVDFTCVNPTDGLALTDGRASLQDINSNALYLKACTLTASADNPSVIVDLGSVQTINSMSFWFGVPFISDYQLYYHDSLTGNWRVFYTGQNNFDFSEQTHIKGSWDFEKTTTWINKETHILEAFEAIRNGNKYIIAFQSIDFNPIRTSKIMMLPVNWQQKASIYEISAYNTDNYLELEEESTLDGNTYFNSEGYYESPINSLNLSEGAKYTKLFWDQGSRRIPSVSIIKNYAREEANVHFFDWEYGNNLGFQYYGPKGGPNITYVSESSGSYPEAGYSNVNYNKRCINDGAWAGQSSALSSLPCVSNAAFVNSGYVYNYNQWNVIDSFGLNNASAYGFPDVTSDSVRGKAAILNGVNNYFRVVTPKQSLNLEDHDMTISFWVKSTRSPNGIPDNNDMTKGFINGAKLFATRDVNNWDSPGFGVWTEGNAGLMLAVTGNNRTSLGEAPSYPIKLNYYWDDKGVPHAMNDGEWHHGVYVISRTGTSYGYIDGYEVAHVDGGFLPDQDIKNSFYMVIGGNANPYSPSQAAELFAGGIDEFMIYNRALSHSEVKQIYQNQSKASSSNPQEGIPTNGLISHWTFDDGPWLPSRIFETWTVFSQTALHSVDRLVISALYDNLNLVNLVSRTGGIDTYTVIDSRQPSGNYNVTLTYDFPSVQSSTFFLFLRSLDNKNKHLKMPILWEVALYKTLKTPLPALPVSAYNITFQFRSGKSKEDVLNSGWYGANSTLNGYFTSPGQIIGSIHNGNPWFQYRIFASTPNINNTPILDNVTIGYLGTKIYPPKAVIKTVSSARVNQPIPILAMDSNEGEAPITSYNWLIGDKASEGVVITHTFNSTGVYLVKLTVNDELGHSDTALKNIVVDPYYCLQPEEPGRADTTLFPVNDSLSQQTALDALREYAESRGVGVEDLDTAEERMDAALSYISNHMSYKSDDESRACAQSMGLAYNPQYDFPQSLSVLSQTSSCGCPNGAAFCGDCEDFSILFTTLVKSMGVNSKCVYSAMSNGHAYNIINYHGKWRVIEPQRKGLQMVFDSGSLEWKDSEGTPYYFTSQIFNDKVSKFSNYATRSFTQNVAEIDPLIHNPVGSNGLPNTALRCNSTSWESYMEYRTKFGWNNQTNTGWDPATLFEDVCQ